jgi:CIC family chloride channel protein
MNKFTRKNLDSLPVVDATDPSKLLGMLRRREVIGFYNQKVDELNLNRAQHELHA